MTTTADTTTRRAWKLVDKRHGSPGTVHATREDAEALRDRMPESMRGHFGIVECDPIPAPPAPPVVPWATRVLVEETENDTYPHTCEATVRLLDDDDVPAVVGIEASYEVQDGTWVLVEGPAVFVWPEKEELGFIVDAEQARRLGAAISDAADKLAGIQQGAWRASCSACGWSSFAQTYGAAGHDARVHADSCPNASTEVGNVDA